jgi:hypothetical protein
MNIKKILEKSLTPNEIYLICKTPFNLILYSDMHKFNNIEQVFNGNKYVIILYEYQKNIGHYVLLFKYDNSRIIEYFDSVYLFPDLVLKEIPINLRISLNENKSYLVNLLLKANYELEYNNKHLQSHNPKIATCGRWCALRIIYNYLSVKDFQNMYLNKMASPDIICAIQTYEISGF